MGKYGFWTFVSNQWRSVAPVLRKDLSGKTVVVVGANTGIGFEAALHFGRMNPERLIIGCRNEDKGNTALSKIKQVTTAKVELWLIDLAQFSSVVAFANKFEKDGAHLDILVMNAGILTHNYEATSDGWESTIQVNHLSTAFLSLLLLPRMASSRADPSNSPAPRLVIVSSEMHSWATIEKDVTCTPNLLETLGSKDYCTPQHMKARYPLSKLLNIFFVRAFDAHLSSPVVTINAPNPGFCYSELRRQFHGVMAIAIGIFEGLFALTSEQGSRVIIRAAIWHKKDEELRGEYITTENVEEPSDYVLSEEGHIAQERIWEETINILSKVDPRVRTVVNEYMTTHP